MRERGLRGVCVRIEIFTDLRIDEAGSCEVRDTQLAHGELIDRLVKPEISFVEGLNVIGEQLDLDIAISVPILLFKSRGDGGVGGQADRVNVVEVEVVLGYDPGRVGFVEADLSG